MQRKGGGGIRVSLRAFCFGARAENCSKERRAALVAKSAAPVTGRARFGERSGVGEGMGGCGAQELPSRSSVGGRSSRKNSRSHIDASHSQQPLVKGERLVCYEANAVMLRFA